MKFIADENIDRSIVTLLRANGYTVFYISEIEPGISDRAVIELANRESSLLLTADKDFGELVFRQGYIPRGVILIRLAGLSPEDKATLVLNAIRNHIDEMLGNFTVISRNAIRIRGYKLE